MDAKPRGTDLGGRAPVVLGAAERRAIAAWNATLETRPALRLAASADPRSARLGEFAAALAASAPRVKLRRDRVADLRPPALEVDRRLAFCAVPRGAELAPFLEALGSRTAPPPALPPALRELARAVQAPVTLSLFVADHCPVCPRAILQLLPLTLTSPLLRLEVVDALLFEDLARKNGVRSLPTLILGEALRWTERFPLDEILSAAGRQDPAALGPGTLEALLADGNAALLAEMMLACGRIFPAFVELLLAERWPVRLGAMVALETLAARSPSLAAEAAAPLMARFDGAPDTVRGDVLHIMGETAGRQVLPWLTALSGRELHPEVAEAAREAAAKLSRRDD
jgi:hypothetical protein